jgi:hypothetical protein
MSDKALSKTNPYLKNRKTARKMLTRSVASSTAIETGESIEKIEARLIRKKRSRSRTKLA